MQAINVFEEKNIPIVTKLALRDPDAKVRYAAVRLLSESLNAARTTAAQSTFSNLAFNDTSIEVRKSATHALDDPAGLVRLSRDPVESVAFSAMMKLALLEPPPEEFLQSLRSVTNQAFLYFVATLDRSSAQTALELLPNELLLKIVTNDYTNYPALSEHDHIYYSDFCVLRAFAELSDRNFTNELRRTVPAVMELQGLRLALKELSPELTLNLDGVNQTSVDYNQSGIIGAGVMMTLSGQSIAASIYRGKTRIAQPTWESSFPSKTTLGAGNPRPVVDAVGLLSGLLQQSSQSPELTIERMMDCKSPLLRLAYASLLATNHPVVQRLVLQDPNGEVRYAIIERFITDEAFLRKVYDAKFAPEDEFTNPITGEKSWREVRGMAWQKLKKLYLDPRKAARIGGASPGSVSQ